MIWLKTLTRKYYSSVGRRDHPSYTREIKDLVLHLTKYELFENILGRNHQAFQTFQMDKVKNINGTMLYNWMTKRKELLAKEERLRYLKTIEQLIKRNEFIQ